MRAYCIAIIGLAAAGLVVFPCLAHGQQTGSVKGIVKDAKTGKVLVGVNLILKDTNYGAATAADGSFQIFNVPVGSYQIRASYIGYNTAVKTVHIHSGQPADVNIILSTKSAQLSQLVVTGGPPISWGLLRLRLRDEFHRPSWTNGLWSERVIFWRRFPG
jgi:iron complex outermembrane receptor protein